MFLQRIPTQPLLKESEAVLVLDVLEGVVVQTVLFIPRRLSQCEECLSELQALFRKGSHLYDGNNHKLLSVWEETHPAKSWTNREKFQNLIKITAGIKIRASRMD